MSLVDFLTQDNYLRTPEIIKAFKRIKREDFVLPQSKKEAEVNAALSIGHNQTISQPATVAFMLELLEPRTDDKILDVGSGSGWTTALLAEIVGENGKVFGIERIAELRDFGESNVAKYNFIKRGRVKIFLGDGYKGLFKAAPFDKILVSAAAEEVPVELLSQLKEGGRMVIPIGEQYENQDIVFFKKINNKEFSEKYFPGFIFVPMIKGR